MEKEKQKINAILVIVFLAIFILNLSYSFYFRPVPVVDAGAYDDIAWNIVRGYGYRELLDVPLADDFAIARVGPGYEFFLAAIYYIFGHHYESVWIIQALLITLSAFFIFLASKEIFKTSWHYILGLTAALFIGFSPDLITIQSMLMTETLAIFLIVIAVYLFFRYVNTERPSGYSALFIGLVLSLAILVRTPTFFMFFPIAVYLLMRKNWRHFLLIGFTILIVFLPWTIRNFKVYREFIPTNIAGGFNLLTGNHPGASGEQEPYPLLSEYVKDLGYVKADKQAAKDAVDFILKHPLEFLKITAYRVSIYFSFSRPTGFWFHLYGMNKIFTLILSSIYSVLLFTLGFWGVIRLKNLEEKEKRNAKLLLAMLFMMPLAIIGIVAETRYRFAVYPFFAIFAGLGLREIVARKLSWKAAMFSVGLLILNTGFDVLRNFSRIIKEIQGL